MFLSVLLNRSVILHLLSVIYTPCTVRLYSCFVQDLCFIHVNIIYLYILVSNAMCLCQIVRVARNCLPFTNTWLHPCFRWDLRCSTCLVFCRSLLVYLLLFFFVIPLSKFLRIMPLVYANLFNALQLSNWNNCPLHLATLYFTYR